MTCLWRRTGHRVAHWLGCNFGYAERGLVETPVHGVWEVVGFRCVGCGEWTP